MPPTTRAIHRSLRFGWKAAEALLHKHRPFLAQLIVTRRCNLACSYCNEFDAVSEPVPLSDLRKRIDRLTDLGTSVITLSGGEPLLHPQLDDVIRHARSRHAFTTAITNGYLLSRKRIDGLNEAGLDHLQISIDNIDPDDVSKKSLRLLDGKLVWLSQYAKFAVSINSVVGAGIRNPSDAAAIARRAHDLGFASTVGIVHDGRGRLKPLDAESRAAYDEIRRLSRLSWTSLNARFQDKLARGEPNDWRCRAGSRFLYVDEFGLVHYCSQRRGAPAIPLELYGREDLRREYDTAKGCAPYCTLNCVQQVAFLDSWRSPQTARSAPAGAGKQA
ncbi:MAG TPA: radical SAM protein [Dehalococcoidia bacterium]|jgi:MoaA/NifB/PqqE/SkfB family radical SAM enzyme